MAYRRRYLSGQAATTVVIAEGAVTTDKIVDKAVTQPKVADNAITTEKIADGAVETEDIKDGEVKTSDLASNSVTTEKIADQAVTVAKLEASIQGIARPLTPGVATAEIANLAVTTGKIAELGVTEAKIGAGAVSAAKIAGDAVETAKIKDANVTLAKLAAGSVDNTKIVADAVRGTEIQNGACSELKIGTDAVVTAKIKALNVTEPKIQTDAIIPRTILADAVTEPKLDVAALSRRHIGSKDTRIITHEEEFGGVEMSNKWRRAGEAGGYVLPAGSTGVKIATGAVNGNDQRIDWDSHYIGLPEDLHPILDMWISTRHATLNKLTQNLGLWNNASNHIVFYAHDVGGATPNWFAKCVSIGAVTSIDTGIPIAASIQLLRIEVISAASVKFYIDGVEEAEVTTNIPTTFNMEPYLEIITREGVLRWFDLKYFSLMAERPAYV